MRPNTRLLTILLLCTPYCIMSASLPAGDLHAKLEFSTNQGRTYTPDFPVAAQESAILVKVSWRLTGETRRIKNGIVTTLLFSTEHDFASANKGYLTQNGVKTWRQRPRKYWFNAATPGSCIFRLDLAARKAGIMGMRNRWDGKSRKFVNAPLPACPRLACGQHRFTVRVGYRLEKTNKPVFTDLDFFVTLQETVPVSANARKHVSREKKSSRPKIPPPPIPDLQTDLVLPVTKATVFNQGKPLKRTGPFIQPAGQDFGWQIDGISPGKYFIRLLIQSGTRTGEDELRKGIPYLFINGRMVPFDRAGPIIPYQRRYVTIIQSAGPVMVRPSDEIRWNRERKGLVGALGLAKSRLPLAPVWINPCRDRDLAVDRFRVSGSFSMSSDKAVFAYTLQNASGRAATLTIEAEVGDYFQHSCASMQQRISLDSWQTVRQELPFTPGNSDRYRAVVRIHASDGTVRESATSCLADRLKTLRKRIWLNRGWQWSSIADNGTLKSRTLPATPTTGKTSWRNTDIPANWQDDPKCKQHHIAWYRKTFQVPAAMQSERYLLHFSRVAYETRIFVNNVEVAHHTNPNGPFNVDITNAIRADRRNTLQLCIRDRIASLKPVELAKKHPEISRAGMLRAPMGMRPGIGEVTLIGVPAIRIHDVAIRTSFRKKLVELTIIPPAIRQGDNLTLSNVVHYRGSPVLAFADHVITAGNRKIHLRQSWQNPILWGPEQFPLLELVSELREPGGRVLDRVRTRFGFREFRTNGRNLEWNGRNVKFAGAPFFSTWSWNLTRRNRRDYIRHRIRAVKRAGYNMLRHIYNSENFADIADEEGMPIAQGGVHTMAHHTRQQIESDEFWEHAAEYAIEMVRGLRNHPSIFEWYLSNEYFGQSEKLNAARLQTYGKKVLAVDNSRPIEFGCDLDLRGFLPLISVHYPVDVDAFRKPGTWLPEAAYWRRFTDRFVPGMKVPCGMSVRTANVYGKSPVTWGEKPIIINETCWISFFRPPDALSRICGDRVYESPWAISAAHNIANTWFSRGHRDAEASVITLWKHGINNPTAISLPRIDINFLQQYNKFFSGTRVTYDVNLTRDLFNTANLTFTWQLRKGDRILQKETTCLRFTSCRMLRRRIQLRMPRVRRKNTLRLTALLLDGNRVLSRQEMPITVYPHPEPISLPRQDGHALRIGLFSKNREEGRVLKSLLPDLQLLTDADPPLQQTTDILIIGENQASVLPKNVRNAIISFVRNNGRLLLLRQDMPQKWLPIPLQTTRRNPALNFTFRPDHPLLADITPDELNYWYPEHKTGEQYYLKPQAGNYLSVVEAGGPNGMIYTGLLEIRLGRGAVIACQLDIVRHLEMNPVAGKLWRNIIACCAVPMPRLQPPFLPAVTSASLASTLQRFGAAPVKLPQTSGFTAALTKCETLILDNAANLDRDKRRILVAFAANGGTILIHNITPDDIQAVSDICGERVTLYPVKPKAWQGRAIRLRADAAIAGLTNYDLFWRKRPESEDYRYSFFVNDAIITDLGDWIISCAGARELLHPGLLLVLERGKGRIVLDNLKWDTGNSDVAEHAARIGCTLLTNLGVELKNISGGLELPPDLEYHPINISKYLNRSFADEKDGDGKGGWTDQGPECDLRSFPLDKSVQTLAGVPFRIEKPLSCLALHSKYRPGAPKQVPLSVNTRADVLFFLQASAWTSTKHHASYVIHYADGSSYSIRLIGGVNMRDWAASSPQAPFISEKDTITRLAWTGKSKKFSKASIYCMAWPNPYPEKLITEIDFMSRGYGIPILIAVTAATRRQQVVRKPSTPAQTARAQMLITDGRAQLKAGKPDKAEKSFIEAISTAWENSEAYLQLGYLYEQQHRYQQAIKIYEQLLQAVPLELEAYMRIAKCWETIGDYRKAVETYRRSLKADINQPDVMKALAEAKKKLKKKE